MLNQQRQWADERGGKFKTMHLKLATVAVQPDGGGGGPRRESGRRREAEGEEEGDEAPEFSLDDVVRGGAEVKP